MRGMTVLLIAVFLSSPAYSQEEKVVKIPLIFSQEGVDIKTSACLKVKEKIYGTEYSDWESFQDMAQNGPEKVLKETILAMQNKDRPRLEDLFHPDVGRNVKKFDEQSDLYFRQFEVLQMGDVISYLRFDNLVIFNVRLHHKGNLFFATFPFMYDEIGNLYFLPSYKGENLAFQLASGWFDSDWAPAKGGLPVYCESSLIGKMTHKVVLEDGNRSNSAAELFLIGNNLTDTNKNSVFYADVLAQITNMKEAITSGRTDDFFDGFSERGKMQNKDWFLNEKEEHLRRKYIEGFVNQKPFYVFDADPLFVVYARAGSSVSQAMYFVRNEKGQFKLSNSAHATILDNIFKGRKTFGAADEESPFGSWEIHKE